MRSLLTLDEAGVGSVLVPVIWKVSVKVAHGNGEGPRHRLGCSRRAEVGLDTTAM